MVSRGGAEVHSQKLLLGLTATKIRMASRQQEFDMFGIHRDELHNFVSELPVRMN